MSTGTMDSFEVMIRDAGQGWLIDLYSPRDEALPALRRKLQSADQAAKNRLGANAPALTVDSLIHEFDRNPHKVRAFLQVIGSIHTPDFLVLVWRILQGMEIDAIKMDYDAVGPFNLSVRLSSPYDDAREEYQSSDIADSVVLRHMATLKIDNQGTFNGFYALNLR